MKPLKRLPIYRASTYLAHRHVFLQPRYVTRGIEYYGQTVPAGSTMKFMLAAANRDERRFPDPDRFDIHRDRAPHMTFGYGIHTCPGNVLARLEGQIFIDEMLKRLPEWDIEMDRAKLTCTSTVRGWDTLSVRVRERLCENYACSSVQMKTA